MKKYLLVFVVFILAFNGVFAQNLEELKSRVEKANKKFVDAMINSDFDTMNSMYTENVISMPSYQPMIRGLNAIKEMGEMQKQSGWTTKHFALNMTDLIPAGSLTIEIGNYEIVMNMPDNTGEWSDNGKYINVWETQEDGSLKIRVETWNTDTNPWENQGEEHYEEPEVLD